MREQILCRRCVLPAIEGDVILDDKGVCNYCLNYEKVNKIIKSRATSLNLEAQIERIKRRNKNKQYDVILGLSGGVDSSYCLYLAVKIYGLRVLALHVDSGWNTEIAVTNIYNAVKKMGVDLYTEVLDWNSIREVQKCFFEASVINCDIPQDHAFRAVQYKIANKFKIYDFISGRNFNTDAMMPRTWVWPNYDGHHVKAIIKLFAKAPIKNYPTFGILYHMIWMRYIKKYKDLRILEMMPYERENAKKIIQRELGWRDYGGKHHESVLTKFLQRVYLPRKFNVDKQYAHYSGLIKNGEITRELALELIDKSKTPDLETDLLTLYFIKKLNYTSDTWENILNMPVKLHADYPNNMWIKDIAQSLKRRLKSIIDAQS